MFSQDFPKFIVMVKLIVNGLVQCETLNCALDLLKIFLAYGFPVLNSPGELFMKLLEFSVSRDLICHQDLEFISTVFLVQERIFFPERGIIC